MNHDRFYSFSEVYDVAFDFKDVPAECAFLRATYEGITGRRPQSFIDIAAGPGLHAIEMARVGLDSAALDLSQDMVEYGINKAQRAGVTVDYRQGNMANFDWDRTFDLAGIFMDSLCYLVDNAVVISHLRSVAQILNVGGLYVLEMSHPRDVFSVGQSTATTWEVERNGLWTSVTWGDNADEFDPISQITNTTVQVRFRANGEEQRLTEKARARCFTYNELQALVLAEGSFEIVAMYGAMKSDVPFSNDKAAWRMIPVLRRRA
ncbi:MAG: class I SAM-dependent methyltransferase [Bdellovibrionaceae bacterium]|nr:class I SAM-dependent methyltransferase [Pseudobdellovibrionaceae bacterium]